MVTSNMKYICCVSLRLPIRTINRSKLKSMAILLFFMATLSVVFMTSENSSKLSQRRNAYVMYATDDKYFCHALINAEILFKQFQVTDDVVIMIPSHFVSDSAILRTRYQLDTKFGLLPLKLEVLDAPTNFPIAKEKYYANCYRKLQVFSLYTEYDRVVFFDSDGMVLKSLSFLFEMDFQNNPIAAIFVTYPIYTRDWLSSVFFAADLSAALWSEVKNVLTNQTRMNDVRDEYGQYPYDMEVFNYIFNKKLVGDRTFLLTSTYIRLDEEFKPSFVQNYVPGDSRDRLNETIYIHFSNEKPFYKKKTRQYTPTDTFKALYHKFWKIEAHVCTTI